jgi:hypothetical protein
MPSRSYPQGLAVANMNAALGTVSTVALTSAVTGTTQGSFIAPSDFVIVTANDNTSNTITLPDPGKVNLTLGDSVIIIHAGPANAITVYPHNASSTIGNAASKTQAINSTAFYFLTQYTPSTGIANWTRGTTTN